MGGQPYFLVEKVFLRNTLVHKYEYTYKYNLQGHSALLPEAEKPKPEPAFIEAPRKGRNRVLRASDSGGEGKEAPGKQLQQQVFFLHLSFFLNVQFTVFSVGEQ